MTFAEKSRKFLEKLRGFSDFKKKIIIFAVVILIGLPMGYFWVTGAVNGLSKINGETQNIVPKFNLPDMPDLSKLQNLPALDILKTASPTDAQPSAQPVQK